MKKGKFISCVSIFAFIFISVLFASDVQASYGIYGAATYAGTSPTNVIDGAVVTIYKYNGSQWAYHGQTTASACGYYTYNTGERGSFKAVVNGYYGLRPMPCSSISGYETVAGFGFGDIGFFTPWVVVNIRTS